MRTGRTTILKSEITDALKMDFSNQLEFPNLGGIFPNMGTIEVDHVNPSKALFSNVQQRVLALIFGNS